jgi:hypothetical protein
MKIQANKDLDFTNTPQSKFCTWLYPGLTG